MKPLYIFDLDGTLALVEHRRHLIPNWRAFFAACVDDQPNTPVIRVMHSLRYAAADVHIFSGRSDEVREQTIEWLLKHTTFTQRELNSSVLRMRKAGDYTPDEVLKKQWLDEMPTRDRMRLMCVFDDRDKVVKMWRDNGVACFQVAPGEF